MTLVDAIKKMQEAKDDEALNATTSGEIPRSLCIWSTRGHQRACSILRI